MPQPEILEQEEAEESIAGSKRSHQGFRLSDSIVLHEDSELKAALVESIRNHLGRPKPTTLDFYRVIRPLGEGSYGKVYLGLSTLTELPVAIKCYDRAKIKSETTCQRILQEIDILKELDHPNVIRFVEIFENQRYIFMVLEYADRDDLFKLLKTNGKFREPDFIPILAQILNGLHYLHQRSILHRDIKLDNILLNSRGQVKICDFGVSRRVTPKTIITEHIGTPAYLAPEIVAGRGYSGFKVDIWSLGVLTFIALLGSIPFKGEAIEDLNENILNAEPVFPEPSRLSPAMMTCIRGMLDKNPKKRLGIVQIAALLNIKIEEYPPSPPLLALSQKQVSLLNSFGFSDNQIHNAVRDREINHITALINVLDINSK